jgi:hypothetical protein
LVAAEVVDVDVAVVIGEGKANAVGGVAIDPAAVGDERDDAGVADAVGGPAKCSDVGVVEGALAASC